MFNKKKDVYVFGDKKKTKKPKTEVDVTEQQEEAQEETVIYDMEQPASQQEETSVSTGEEIADNGVEKNEKRRKIKFTKPDLKMIVRDKKKVGIILIVSSLLVILVIAPLLNITTSQKMTTVVVATSDIKKGKLIDAKALAVANVPVSSLLPIHITSKDLAVGTYAKSDIVEGEMILKPKLSSTVPFEDAYLYELPSGKKAISVTMKNLSSSVSNKLLPGDIVTIYSRANDTVGAKKLASDLLPELEYVKVLAVVDEDGAAAEDGEKNEEIVNTVVLLVDDSQASILAGLESVGTIHCAIVCRSDDERAANYLKVQDEKNAKESETQ